MQSKAAEFVPGSALTLEAVNEQWSEVRSNSNALTQLPLPC